MKLSPALALPIPSPIRTTKMTDLCAVIWCSFEQDGAAMIYAAAIGLFGGFLALMGAVIVGYKQAQILGRQTELQEKSLLSELFDKRFAVYERVRAYVGETISLGHPPGIPRNRADVGLVAVQKQMQIARDYFEALDLAQFLFSRDVVQRLKTVNDKLQHLHSVDSRIGSQQQQPDDTQTALDLMLFIAGLNLAEVFGAELALGS